MTKPPPNKTPPLEGDELQPEIDSGSPLLYAIALLGLVLILFELFD